MSFFPTGYNPDGLAPSIIIYNKNFQKIYEYNHPRIGNIQDFVLLDWKLSLGVNSDAGSASITIEDHNGDFVNDKGTVIIRPGFILQINLGKTSDSVQTWFTGIINEPQLERPGFKQQLITLQAYGYGSTLTNRFVTIKHDAILDADGSVSGDDNSAKVSEIARRIIQDDSLQVIPPADNFITADSIADIDIKLANLDKQIQSQQIILAELANIINGVYGITPDLDFYFRGNNTHGGFIATNDNNIISRTNSEVLMIMRNQPYSYKDTIIKKAYTDLVGLDVTLTTDRLTSSGADRRNFGTKDYTVYTITTLDDDGNPTPYRKAIPADTLEILLYQVETIPTTGQQNRRELAWQIAQYTLGSNVLSTVVETNSVFSADTLNTELKVGSNEWVKLKHVDLPAISSNRIRGIVLSDGSQIGSKIQVVGKNNSGTTVYDANNHPSYVQAISGSFTLRVRSQSTKQVILKAQNTELRKQQIPKQSVQSLTGQPASATATTLFEGILGQAGQIRRIYSDLIVSAPTNRPDLGRRITIKDSYNNIDTNALLIGIDAKANSRGKDITCQSIGIEAEEIID